jgi:hypothetical protein
MQDYYTVITRAVSRLEDNTHAARKAVFDRARVILIDHFRIRQPPASNSEIALERSALEDAIRKIESELAKVDKSRQGSGPASSIRYSDSADLRTPDKTAVTNVRRGRKEFLKSVHPAKSTNAARQQTTQTILGFFNQSRMTLARLLRIRRRRVISSKTAPSAAKNAIGPIVRCTLPHTHRGAPNLYEPRVLAESRSSSFSEEGDPTNKMLSSAIVPMIGNLLGIQLLDQLMVDAAHPAAPNSLKADARRALEWLGIDKPEAIKIEHYDRFTRGFQRYISECQTSLPGLASATNDPPLILNDDIRGIFSRLLEREQTTRIFDKALAQFAKIWIGTVIVLNAIVIIGLVATSPSLRIGVFRFAEAYSLSNVWNFAAQLVAVSPALTAMAWLHRRLSRLRIAA